MAPAPAAPAQEAAAPPTVPEPAPAPAPAEPAPAPHSVFKWGDSLRKSIKKAVGLVRHNKNRSSLGEISLEVDVVAPPPPMARPYRRPSQPQEPPAETSQQVERVPSRVDSQVEAWTPEKQLPQKDIEASIRLKTKLRALAQAASEQSRKPAATSF